MHGATPPGKAPTAPNQLGGANGDASGASQNASSSLDHALLESLFYNEMMLMDESPSLLLSTLAADGTPTTVDPSTLAEKALLQDFGVSSFPAASTTPHVDTVARTTTAASVTTNTTSALPTRALASGTRGVPASLAPPPSATAAISSANLPPPQAAHAPKPVPAASSSTGLTPLRIDSAAATTPVTSEEEKRDKLVSQFTTLASRLGISLPSQLVQSLAAGAAENTLHLTTTASAAAATTTTTFAQQSSHVNQEPPQVKQLQSTAEAAIAAVTRKRSSVDDNNKQQQQQQSSYNKRRKKPRLSDCEHKLAELQTENALLKRHLHNVSDQTYQMHQEQKAVEKRIRELWKANAKGEELDAIVQQFSEQYSDYGKRRHHELNFHLEQLERYVLYSLGESVLGCLKRLNEQPLFASILCTHAFVALGTSSPFCFVCMC